MNHDRSATDGLLLESIVENLPDMVFVKDAAELRFVRFNRAGEALLGWERAALLGRSDRDFFPPDEADFFTAKDRDVLRGGELVDIPEEPIHTAHGLRWLHTKKIPILDEATGQPLFLLGISRDVTELREARVGLEEREAQLRVLLDHFPGVVWSSDGDDRLTWVGGSRAGQLGVAGTEGRKVSDVFPAPVGASLDALHDVSLAGAPADYSFASNGRYFVARLVPLPGAGGARVVGVALNVTERRQLEAEKLEARLQRAQRLEALGVLAGGIAHDFNNLLTGILGHANLAKALLPPGSPAGEHLDRIEAVAERAGALTKQMLAYSGRGRFVIEPVDVSALVRDLAELLAVALPKQARLVLELAPDLPAVQGDAAQLRQVLLNLMTNASDALETREGTVRVATALVTADAALLATTWSELTVAPGEYVSIEVADTGVGMDAAIVARMFNPFFSTKEEGHGLGLAATLGIVRGHGGTLRVRSAEGEGTVMSVLLPARPDLAAVQPTTSVTVPARGTGSCVLVVDDEEEVRNLAAKVLRRDGYEVLTAADGLEAVEVLRAHPDVRVVLLDLTMPRMGGLAAFDELRRIRPDLRTVLSSGYDEADVAPRITSDRLAAFLGKPWSGEDLLNRIREILAR